MKKVILFGAGNKLRDTIKYLDLFHVKIQAICDNDSQKWGKVQCGYKIISSEAISKISYDYIIISNITYCEQIKKQLYLLGIKRVLPLYANRLTKNEKKLYDYSLNIYGKVCIWSMHMRNKQAFFPTILGLWTNPYFHARRGLAKSLADNKQCINGNCLDFGCGNKPYEGLFNTKEYIGVEIEGEEKREGIVYYDGNTIPFDDNYFDSIICSQVFEHISNLDEIMGELCRVLKTGGYMLVTMPFAYPEHLVPYDFRRFTSFGIRNYLEKSGFEVVQYYKAGSFIEAICQMKNVYINEVLFGKKNHFVKKLMCFYNNVSGLFFAKILPESNTLYLDNIVVVRKK